MRVLRKTILASASPRRRELLGSLGLDVRVVPSRYEERPAPGVPPRALAERHAQGKASAAVIDGLSAGWLDGSAPIVAADTVVDVDGTALGKPTDDADARRMLRLLAGRRHEVHTAFCVRSLDGRAIERTCSSAVYFYPLSDDEMEDYVSSGDGADKAGAYGIQGRGALLVERVEGDFYTVVGFPLAAFARAVQALDWTVSLGGALSAQKVESP